MDKEEITLPLYYWGSGLYRTIPYQEGLEVEMPGEYLTCVYYSRPPRPRPGVLRKQADIRQTAPRTASKG